MAEQRQSHAETLGGRIAGDSRHAAPLTSVRRAERLGRVAYRRAMRIDDDRQRLDMTTEAASWVWKNDQEGYDDWVNACVQGTPESWDGDDAIESIILAYIQHLERLVTAAYGADGLERYHEGVAETITALEEMNTIRDWVKTNLPHVDTSEGVAKPVLGLLHITKSAVDSILPVFQSIISTFGSQYRALGLYRETR